MTSSNGSVMNFIKRTVTSPQLRQIGTHLCERGSISQLEAEALYRVKRLASRIHELGRIGVNIRKEFKNDLTGKRYVRYHLA